MLGGNRRPEPGREDQIADPEQLVIGRVALVEMVFGAGHQRRGAERVADLVDVPALEVLEHGNGADREVDSPVRRHAGVHAPAAVGLDQRDQLVDLGALGRVRAALGGDAVGVAAVERSQLRATPARARGSSRRRRPRPTVPCEVRPSPGEPAACVHGGRRRPSASARARARPAGAPRRAAAREEQRGELDAHHEPAKEDVAAAGDHVDQRSERGPAERQQQARGERDHERAGARVRPAPAQRASARPIAANTVTTGIRP